MKKDSESTAHGRQQTTTLPAHCFTAHDLREAVELHRAVMDGPPNAQMAEYAREQIWNIVKSVVPNQVLLDTLVTVALAQFEKECSALRQKRNEVDKEWKMAERDRREVEMERRVKERWRGPY